MLEKYLKQNASVFFEMPFDCARNNKRLHLEQQMYASLLTAMDSI